jgi:hypothetical protein
MVSSWLLCTVFADVLNAVDVPEDPSGVRVPTVLAVPTALDFLSSTGVSHILYSKFQMLLGSPAIVAMLVLDAVAI